METLYFDTKKSYGNFKILNGTNGGPWHCRYAKDQWRSNFEDYKKAGFPYARNHDVNIGGSDYGAPYSTDITAIFPDFNADENKVESYDFACTDEYISMTLEAGTKTFYRLGQSIEHQIKKHGTLPPPDFNKWAGICEHIIRHYTEGWADGFCYDMPYWEIWNEADLDEDDSSNKRTWGGTRAEFFDLYEITAKHLKKCFPNLKIGGPALAFRMDWAKDFLIEMKKRNVPIDFFSWHIYHTEPEAFSLKAEEIRQLLDETGYKNTESILNEWNYVRGWEEDFLYSIETIGSIKGASFAASVIAQAQKSSIDMLMYYDTRPSSFCGVFDFYTFKPKKSYYPFYWYSAFYDMSYEIRAQKEIKNIYTLSGVDKNGKTLTMITNYSEKEDKSVEIRLDFGKKSRYKVYLTDEKHNGEKISETSDLNFTIPMHSILLIKEL